MGGSQSNLSVPGFPDALRGLDARPSGGALGTGVARANRDRGLPGAASAAVLPRKGGSNLELATLIVNNQPELPLKVPLEYCALPIGQKVEDLKKKNLDRHENAAIKLGELADRERLLYLEKLKKRKKVSKLIEE